MNSIVFSGRICAVPKFCIINLGDEAVAVCKYVVGVCESGLDYDVDIVKDIYSESKVDFFECLAVKKTAQMILDAREKYPKSSLADLYDPDIMPPELRKAHQANDRAVMQAYGMPIRETDEAACVAWLMRLYQEKILEFKNTEPKQKTKR